MDPSERWSCAELLKHPYFGMHSLSEKNNKLSCKIQGKNIVYNLKIMKYLVLLVNMKFWYCSCIKDERYN